MDHFFCTEILVLFLVLKRKPVSQSLVLTKYLEFHASLNLRIVTLVLDRFFLFLNTNNVDVKKDRENLRILEENIAKMKKEFEIFENRVS